MYEMIEKLVLKSGENAELGVVRTPDDSWKDSILEIFDDSQDPPSLPRALARWYTELALTQRLGTLEVSIFTIRTNKTLAGILVSSVSSGFCLAGNLETRIEHRRKGIAALLMKAIVDKFSKGDGIMTAAAIPGGPSQQICFQLGWVQNKDNASIIEYSTSPSARETLYTPSEIDVGSLQWEDYPSVLTLGCRIGEPLIRTLSLGQIGPTFSEHQFLQFWRRMNSSFSTAKVMRNINKAVVGLATLTPEELWNNRCSRLDFDFYPGFERQSNSLLEAIDWPQGRVLTYADGTSQEKVSLLKAHGFKEVGKVENFLAYNAKSLDAHIFVR